MSFESAIALSIAIFVLGITPGPGVFAIVARALALGFRSTLVFIVGIIAGDLVYLVLAALGLSVIATQYGAAFGVLKIIGGVYLIYLGIQTWRSAKHADAGLTPEPQGASGRSFLTGPWRFEPHGFDHCLNRGQRDAVCGSGGLCVDGGEGAHAVSLQTGREKSAPRCGRPDDRCGWCGGGQLIR